MHSLTQPISTNTERHHPSRMRWDMFLLEELAVSEHKQLQAHLETCSHCQEQVTSMQAERRAFEEQLDMSAFMGEMMERERTSSSWSFQWDMLLRPFVWGPLMTAAAFALFFGMQSNNKVVTSPYGTGQLQKQYHRAVGVKGTPALSIYRFRGTQRITARSGATYKEGDTLGFAYRGKGFRYLFMVLIDAKGEVSWLYPGEDGKRSMPIASHGQLKGSIELDGSKGKERLLTFFSMKPLTKEAVKTLIPQVKETRRIPSKDNPIFAHHFLIQK
ncbi:MAG: hypothetical protein CL920_05070 [Deltaproteobacteria bacterium]|nr:hypothetical protein [Deltaproteobacteria bacterium]